MSVALALAAGLAISAPHLLQLEGAHAPSAAGVWLLALGLRALVAVYAAVFAIFFLPTTDVFGVVTHWCWHAGVPLFARHIGLSGHSIGDLALLAPVIGLAVSLTSVSLGLWRAARAISVWVRRTSIGPGPQRSLIVGENDIVIAAAGLRRPRVIISAGALTTLDDEELAASLAHEQCHIVRRHQLVLVFAEVCCALGRLLPGTRRAVHELVFHLERDADRWAVERRHDPRALASAICKAAQRRPAGGKALMTLGGGGVTRRVRQLLGAGTAAAPRRRRHLDLLATSMALLVLALGVALPSAASAGVHAAASNATAHPCPT